MLEHDESLSGHQELYLVIFGHARFEVNGEEIDAPAGTIVVVSDPGARRRAVATADDTEILTAGATPGEPFAHSAWEYGYIVRVSSTRACTSAPWTAPAASSSPIRTTGPCSTGRRAAR